MVGSLDGIALIAYRMLPGLFGIFRLFVFCGFSLHCTVGQIAKNMT